MAIDDREKERIVRQRAAAQGIVAQCCDTIGCRPPGPRDALSVNCMAAWRETRNRIGGAQGVNLRLNRRWGKEPTAGCRRRESPADRVVPDGAVFLVVAPVADVANRLHSRGPNL